MPTFRTLALGVLTLLLSAHAAVGQDRSRYRNFELGGSLSSVAALSGTPASEASVVHQHPVLMQALTWRPAYFVAGSTIAQTDSVQQIVFSFYDDQLSRMVVDYDRQRTEGMTDVDMIDALSVVYGPSSKPAVKKSGVLVPQLEQESGTSLARWGDAQYSVVLYRSTYLAGFRLVVTSPRLEGLAQAADASALLQEQREAPQRELARQKQEADDARDVKERARRANQTAFKP